MWKKYDKNTRYSVRIIIIIFCTGTKIVFNEKVKVALEQTGLITEANGLEFVEFTEYKIEMLANKDSVFDIRGGILCW